MLKAPRQTPKGVNHLSYLYHLGKILPFEINLQIRTTRHKYTKIVVKINKGIHRYCFIQGRIQYTEKGQ